MEQVAILSPELVLVSPELREAALLHLPPPGSFGTPRKPELPSSGSKTLGVLRETQDAPEAPAAPAGRRRPSPFEPVEFTLRVPLIAAAAAYVTAEIALRVAGGVGTAAAIVGGYSLLAG